MKTTPQGGLRRALLITTLPLLLTTGCDCCMASGQEGGCEPAPPISEETGSPYPTGTPLPRPPAPEPTQTPDPTPEPTADPTPAPPSRPPTPPPEEPPRVPPPLYPGVPMLPKLRDWATRAGRLAPLPGDLLVMEELVGPVNDPGYGTDGTCTVRLLSDGEPTAFWLKWSYQDGGIRAFAELYAADGEPIAGRSYHHTWRRPDWLEQTTVYAQSTMQLTRNEWSYVFHYDRERRPEFISTPPSSEAPRAVVQIKYDAHGRPTRRTQANVLSSTWGELPWFRTSLRFDDRFSKVYRDDVLVYEWDARGAPVQHGPIRYGRDEANQRVSVVASGPMRGHAMHDEVWRLSGMETPRGLVTFHWVGAQLEALRLEAPDLGPPLALRFTGTRCWAPERTLRALANELGAADLHITHNPTSRQIERLFTPLITDRAFR